MRRSPRNDHDHDSPTVPALPGSRARTAQARPETDATDAAVRALRRQIQERHHRLLGVPAMQVGRRSRRHRRGIGFLMNRPHVVHESRIATRSSGNAFLGCIAQITGVSLDATNTKAPSVTAEGPRYIGPRCTSHHMTPARHGQRSTPSTRSPSSKRDGVAGSSGVSQSCPSSGHTPRQRVVPVKAGLGRHLCVARCRILVPGASASALYRRAWSATAELALLQGSPYPPRGAAPADLTPSGIAK